jgi:diguanylate cyclase (GGDEF)-like protein/PAS domain S-box-containing protein
MNTELLIRCPGGSAAPPPDVFARVYESFPDALALLELADGRWKVVFINPAFTRLTGYLGAAVIGQDFEVLLAPAGDETPGRAAVTRALDQRRSCQAIVELLRWDDARVWCELTLAPVRDEQGTISRLSVVLRDVTARREEEERTQRLARLDPLTGLANRAWFARQLESFVREQAGCARGALLYFDLDNFKLINDSLGHLAGDRVLTEFAGVLLQNLGPGDLGGRFGGDEFVALLRSATQAEALAVANLVRAGFEQCDLDFIGQNVELQLCGGVADFDGELSATQFLDRADQACCAAKRCGKNRVETYAPDHAGIVHVREVATWSIRLKEALRKEQFELWFQPIVSLATGLTAYHEALVRMRDAEGQLISPGQFLPVAERLQIAPALDRQVIRVALHHLATNRDLRLSINLSGQSFDNAALADEIESAFAAAGVAPARANFEITETALLSNLQESCRTMRRLQAAGFRFALDDFGCGYSSLSYLRDLPVDILKIDASFIRGICRDPVKEILVGSIKETARLLGLLTVAEFIEDEPTVELLRNMGIDYGQGNFLWEARKTSVSSTDTAFRTKASLVPAAVAPGQVVLGREAVVSPTRPR